MTITPYRRKEILHVAGGIGDQDSIERDFPAQDARGERRGVTVELPRDHLTGLPDLAGEPLRRLPELPQLVADLDRGAWCRA